MRKGKVLILFLLFSICHAYGQRNFNFRIRTITAGAPLRSLADTISIRQAVNFLKQAQKEFIDAGYQVQTLRIATSNFFTHVDNRNPKDALPLLKIFDNIVAREGISVLSIGQVLPPGKYRADIGEWAA